MSSGVASGFTRGRSFRVSELQRLAALNGVPVEIPVTYGSDTEFVVDFGRILSGFLEFEVESPAGMILDFYGFEFFMLRTRQDTYRADNTLRYTCRAGRQSFVSPVSAADCAT